MQEALKKQRDSLDKQRQAIHQQLADMAPTSNNPVAEFIEPLSGQIQADCPSLDLQTINTLIGSAAKKQSLQPELVHAVMKHESAFKPCAVSVRGAQGLMQLMPATAQQLHVKDVFDPEQNVQAGAAYLKQLLDRYKGDLRLALVAYNAGPGRADQPVGQPYPLETQNYVASILAELGISPWDDDSSNPPLDTNADDQLNTSKEEPAAKPASPAAAAPPEPKPTKP